MPNGRLLDARGETSAQALSPDELTALWGRLHLTTATGVVAAQQATVDAFTAAVKQHYTTYWNLLGSGAVAAGAFTLSSSALDLYRAQTAASLAIAPGLVTDQQIRDYAAALYTSLVAYFTTTLGAGFASTPLFGATFNPAFLTTYMPSGPQVTALTQNAKWTPGQLSQAVNLIALNAGTGPVGVGTAAPNLAAHNVTVSAQLGVGKLAQSLTIAVADLQAGTLTPEQAAAIALAVTPGSVTVTGTPGTPSYTLVVAQTAPLFVAATGVFIADAPAGPIHVQSSITILRLHSVTAHGTVDLASPGSIIADPAAVTPTIVAGGDLILTAGSGDILGIDGATPTPLIVQIAGIVISAVADHRLYLRQVNDDLRFDHMGAGDEAVITAPDGGILQQTPNLGIAAHTLTLTAGDGPIGSVTQAVTVLLDSAGTLHATATGSIWITGTAGQGNTAGDLPLDQIVSSTGNVTLETFGSILAPDPSKTVISANNVSLIADHGSVGAAGADLRIDSAVNAAGIVNATSGGGGGVFLTEVIGDLSVGLISTSTTLGTETVYLTTINGAILSGAAGPNIVAPNTRLTSSTGIGVPATPLSVHVGHIVASTAAVSISLFSTAAITVGDVPTEAGVASTFGLSAPGNITLTSVGTVTVDQSVTATGNVVIESTAGSLLVHTGSSVGAHGTVKLLADHDVHQEIGTSITSDVSIEIAGDELGTIGHTAILLEGALQAPQITIEGNDGPDLITLHPTSLSGHTSVLGGDGADTIVVLNLPSVDLAHKLSALRNTVDLDGQGGADAYVIQRRGPATT